MLSEILASVLGLGILFFVFNKAVEALRYKIRGFINLAVGSFLIIVFVVAFLLDYERNSLMLYIPHLSFIGSSIIYTISFATYFFTHNWGINDKKQVITTKSYFQEYLYLIYRYQNDLYLINEKDFYQGKIIRLKKTDFHDEIISSINKKNNLIMEYEEIKKQGTVIDNKNKKIYHCYCIDLQKEGEIKEFTKMNAFKLFSFQLNDFNKKVISLMVLRENFNITI